MGYYVDYDMNVTIPADQAEGALKTINRLHDPEYMANHASGGSFGGGQRREVWYSWTQNPPPGGFTSLDEALNAWRFEPYFNQKKQYWTFNWHGEKLGDEEQLFEAIAPYMNGEIFARGEDGEEWGFSFKVGQPMSRLICRKEWVEDPA